MTYTDDIARTLALFFRLTRAKVLEIRRVTPCTTSCFLTPADIATVANLIVDTDDTDVEATYITLNPVKPSLLSRSHARFKRVGQGEAVSDSDIVSRRLVLVDFDPVRKPAKTCSTEREKAAALERAIDCQAWLVRHQRWTRPIFADSGNGYHLLFPTNLRNNARSDRLVNDCLKLLDLKFSDEVVKVDTAVGNASRITKLYGSWVRKGQATFERPWRRSALIEVPGDEAMCDA